LKGWPKGFYRIEAVRVIADVSRSRARVCLVIREEGKAGYSYYCQEGDRVRFLLWKESLDEEVDLSGLSEPEVKPVAVPEVKKPPQVCAGPRIIQVGSSTYRVGADGSWSSVESPAPVVFG